MTLRREIVGAVCALVVTACSAAVAGPNDGSVSSLVDDVGHLPAVVPAASTSSDGAGLDASTSTSRSQTTTTTIDFVASGNRILMIGDSILASTSRRYSNTMCAALVPLGWQVEIEAEVSRGIDFGRDVLSARLSAGWDAVLIYLGTNYGGNDDDYLRRLDKLITTLAPRPVVLVTVTEVLADRDEVNDIIEALAALHPDQVTVLDWSRVLSTTKGLVNEDGVHLSEHGREVFAESVAWHLGAAPTQQGKCLNSTFTDDSAGSVDGKSGPTTTVKKSGGGGTATTVKPATTTTVKPATSTTASGSSSTTPSPTSNPSPTTPVATTTPVTTPTSIVVTVTT